MQSKRVKWQIQLPFSIFLLFLTVVLGFIITVFSEIDVKFWAFYILSIFLVVQITSLFHELGHYIATVKSGFEVYYFNFSFITIDKFGKKRIKFSLFNQNLGEIRYYPKKQFDYAKQFKKSLLGGIIGSIIVAVILNLVLVLAILGIFGGNLSKFITVIFSFSPYSLYVLLVNGIAWFHPENDASKMRDIIKSPEQEKAINNFFAIQKELFDGKTYAEMQKEIFSFGVSVSQDIKVPILLSSLKRAIEINDMSAANVLSQIIEKENYDSDELSCELLYKFIICNEKEKVDEYSYVLRVCKDEKEPYFLRVSLAYAKYVGDEQYFRTLKPTAIKLCKAKTVCKGDVLFNEKLISAL